MRAPLAEELAAFAAAVPTPRRTDAAPASPAPHTLTDRPDGTVVHRGGVVVKAHAPDTDRAALGVRIRLAAAPRLDGILLPPLPVLAREGALSAVLHGRPVTAWPYGTPVDPEHPEAAPWEDAARLLARLHATPPGELPGPLPQMRGPAKVARAIRRMKAAGAAAHSAAAHPAGAPVLAAWRRLPPWARGEAPAPRADVLCHGDLHLGQLVRHPAPDGPWLLIDIDDMGLGDPAWDLARPAAWYAAGLLTPEIWLRFLGAYREAGGLAVRPDGDPWPELDVPARALTVQTAALALAKAAAEDRAPDEVEELMIAACVRIASLPPELEFEASS
ncbi:phosphotransferase family protein [Streptomyces sp. SYSU K217416]